jgi:peptidoglycan/xylan/chitin deacetylase (PgdA/CDA1 family)/GT2 family glycosyltransferase
MAPRHTEMKLSIIIATFNRRALLLRTLSTVLDQTFPASDYEVIVVVDGSTDETAAALRRISSSVRLLVIEQENRGQAAARNAGLGAATGELVLFLDDDLFCERNLIAEHVAAHVDGNSLVFGPTLLDPRSPETLAAKWLRLDMDNWLSQLENKGVCWPDNAIVRPNSSVRRDTVVSSGAFDENFFRAYEDWELGYRLWKSGLHFRFCPTALTHQYYTKSSNDFILDDAMRYGANEVLFCRKHPEMRIHSTLASEKSALINYSARLPFSIDPLLRLPELLATSDAKGISALTRRLRFAMHRSAIKASGGWDRFEDDYAKLLPVLMYHRIGPDQAGTYPSLTVNPGRFRKQMEWLKKNNYSTIGAGDWLAYCQGGKPLPQKPVLLTFDDAYEDLTEYAFPVLREYGFTAAVFVVTGEIGGDNSWDRNNGSSSIRCMSAQQIRHWSTQGIEFGAHTWTHADLTTLSGSELESEIAGSGDDLAEVLGAAPLSFAYPFGYYNEAALSCAENVFRLAFTCDEGLNTLGTGPCLLRRTMVKPQDTLIDFGLRVRFGFNPIERIRDKVRLRSRLRGMLGMLKGL